MRWLFVLGFVVACSSSVADDGDRVTGTGGEDAESGGGSMTSAGSKPTVGGSSAASGAPSAQAGAPVASGAGAGGDAIRNAGEGGAGGRSGSTPPLAGEGGEAKIAGAGAGGIGGEGSEAGAAGAAGAGGQPDECVCSSGPCCDGCQYRKRSHFCGETLRDAYCSSDTRITRDYWNLFCNGDSSECTRWAVHTRFVDSECPSARKCVNSACQD